MSFNENNKSEIIKEYDIIIVGGGLSGLISLYKIKQKISTLNVILFEASENIGGQLQNTELGEIGAKWIIKEQYHIFNLCNNLDVTLSKKLFLEDNRYSRCWDIDKGIFSFICKFEIKRFINDIDLKSVNRIK